MALLRPRLKQEERRDTGVVIAGSGGIEIIVNITDGPGILKGGAYAISGVINPLTDFDWIITVDGFIIHSNTVQFTEDIFSEMDLGGSAPWLLPTTATTIDFSLQEPVNLAFLSSFKIELVNNNASPETVAIIGGLAYHVGAS